MKQWIGTRSRMLAVFSVGLIALSAIGCAEEVDDIDRTQPNRLEKAELAGTWYFLQTIIDVPQQSSQAFIGLTNFGANSKVLFEVTEHYLYVLPVAETVKFSERKWHRKKIRNYWEEGKSNEFIEMYVGQAIAAYPIESHFDVIRDFNKQNGKQSNTLVEDTTLNKWHERKYMRVNWGGNAIFDWAFATGSRKFTESDHHVQQVQDQTLLPDGAGANPDLLEYKDGYVGFVTKAYVPPSGADWQGWSCSPYGISNKDCAGVTVKIRHSFKRAPETADYETFSYTNREHMEKFGFFLADRYGYDELWNITESMKDYKAQRWNLWQTTWANTPIENEAGERTPCWTNIDCGTDDQVLDYKALRCIRDHTFKPGYCAQSELKQFKDRGLKPVVYHLSAYTPDQLRAEYYESAENWSQAFKETAAWLLTLEKAGRYWTKSCSTDADCTAGRDDVLVDATIDTPKQEPLQDNWKEDPANPDAAKCPAGTGAKGGVCQAGVACTEDSPCTKGQVCSGGLCYTDKAAKPEHQVLNPVLIPGPKAITMVVYPDSESATGANVIPVRDDFLRSADKPWQNVKLGADTALVRFVNATPGSGEVELKVGGSTVAKAGYEAQAWVEQGYVVSSGSAELKAGSASTNMTLEPGFAYIAAYVGGNALVVNGTKVGSKTGIRFMHAMPGSGEVDGGSTGVRVVEALAFGELSEYTPSRFETARITVNTTGSLGDLTCYHTLKEGKCAGWNGSWGKDHQADYEKTYKEMPDMYVLCENSYDAAGAATNLADADAKGRLNTYHDGRYAHRGSNPYAPQGARTLEDSEAVFNPCEHFVDDADKIKKIGDVRYNYMYWVGETQASSPLGYGPSAGDPETGELIWGTAYVYGAPTLTYGQWATDLVDMINGKLSTEDVITGKYIADYVARKGDPLPKDNSGSLFDDAAQFPQAGDHKALFQNHHQFTVDGVIHVGTDPMKNTEIWDFLADPDYRKQLLSGLPTVPTGYTQDRLDAIRGTQVENLMINQEVKMALAGGQLDAGESLSQEWREKLSPASWAGAAAVREHEDHRSHVLAHAPCTYDREFVDPHIYGIAKEHFCTDEDRKQIAAGTSDKVCLEGDALRWELTKRIFRGVNLHEVGHTVGLRHNFGGSADLFNFFEPYYTIRQKELVYCQATAHCDEDVGELCTINSSCTSDADCPQGLTCSGNTCMDAAEVATGTCTVNGAEVQKFVPRSFQTEQEALNKMSEYQYSTIMDYGGRFNSDVHGLGKYDFAAIKFGYGKLVDVYQNVSGIRDRMEKLAAITGRPASWFGYFLDTDRWRNSGVIFSPFYYLENYIGVENNRLRLTVPYEAVKYEHAMQTNYDDDRFHWSFVEVPYRFCSDEFRGNLGCYTWDTGVDVGEMVATAVNSVNEYYVFDAFKRGRMYTGSDRLIQSYFLRVQSRFLAIMGDAGRYFAIYDNIFNDRPWYQDFIKNPHAMRTLARASKTSFNHLAQMLASPAPGSFMRDAEGVYRNVTYDLDAAGTELTVPIGEGKFPYTQYMDTSFYGYENHVVWVGSFWLKLAALLQLTDSTFYSSSNWVGEQLEIGRSSAVGFNTLYQREMTNLIGGIVADSLSHYSNVVETVDGEKVFRPRDLFDAEADKGKDLIEPGLNNLTMKLYASVFGLSNLPSGFDPSFTDAMTVFLEGSGHEFNLAAGGAGVKKATFADPFGAKTYIAYQPNYDAGRLAPAYRIVKSAQAIRDDWEQASGAQKAELASDLKRHIEMLDILRQLHSIYGNLVY